MDTAYTNHSDHPAIALDHLSCPSSSKETCVFQRRTYQITVPARLNISASAVDNTSILTLASEASTFNDTHPLFIDRNISVGTTDIGNLFVEVKPGENGTLEWVPYLLHAVGTLEGCSNKSLNGMVVEATAPYLANSTNGSFTDSGGVGGYWLTDFANNTGDKENAGGRLGNSGLGAAMVGTVIMAIVFATAL
jgi:hypothetical protein